MMVQKIDRFGVGQLASKDEASIPTITTERLTLRPLTHGDAATVQELAGERAIADTTLLIPHPYPDGAAEEWIATHQPSFAEGKGITLAITLTESQALMGAIGLIIHEGFNHAEMGYWVGVPYWGKGYCSEAAAGLLKYGFETRRFNRIHAHHFGSNPASGKVLTKIGMSYEGTFRQHIKKWERFEDAVFYGILRSDYEAR